MFLPVVRVVPSSSSDPLATRVIPASALPVILKRTSAPLGVMGNHKKAALFRVLRLLSEGQQRLPIHRGQLVTFHEVIMALAARHFGRVAMRGGLGTTRFALQHEHETRTAGPSAVS